MLEPPVQLDPLSEQALVSVLVANYNYGHFVQQALDSVLCQSYGSVEVIVCDDGSSDDSCEIIQSYVEQDERITFIPKENGGVASALNAAFEASRGEIICLLDADDYFEPSKVEKVVTAFRHHDWGLLVHPMMVVDGRGKELQRKPAFSMFEQGWLGPRNIERGGRWMYMEASAVCMRRAIAERAFPIPVERFRSWADAYICTLAALLAPVGYLDEPLAFYRLHSSNTSGFSTLSTAQSQKGVDGVRRVVAGVNERLGALGISGMRLEESKHLTLIESSYQVDLFGGEVSRSKLIKRYRAYLREMRRDGLYSPARRILAILFLGSAIALPARWRPGWVSGGMTESRFKERVRVALRPVTRILKRY